LNLKFCELVNDYHEKYFVINFTLIIIELFVLITIFQNYHNLNTNL